MTITHVVQFGYKPDTSAERAQELFKHFASLKDKCIKPDTGKPYLKSWVGGKQNSIEPHTQGLQYVFVMEFENDEDREYYTHRDPAHLYFVEQVGPHIDKIQVSDFAQGQY